MVNAERAQDYMLGRLDLDKGFTLDDGFNEKVVDPMNEARPQERDFMDRQGGPYPSNKVKEDLAEIRRIENLPDFEKQNTSSAIALEAATAFLISNSKYNILGENADARLASKYDDVKRGCDVIVSLFDEESEDEPVLFALDVKTCDEIQLARKLSATLDALDRGYHNSVEYYVDQNEEMIGHVDLPKFIFHMPAESVDFLQNTIIISPEDRSDQQKNEVKIFQADFVDKIKMQAREMILYILTKKFSVDDNLTDDELINWLEDNMQGDLAKRLNQAALKNIQQYLGVLSWMTNFQQKNKLPAVGELVTTFFDARFVQALKTKRTDNKY